ncbi:MAG: hypothetical protein JWP89_3995 [Schlesneria sp.]|nr:hypothetical protein [Schlesneria sp.]
MAKSRIPKPPKVLGLGCAALFAIPFAAVGVFMGWMVVATLAEHRAMQRWVETPAVITRADLQVQHGDGATYKTTAEYQYEFGGQKRQGARVGLSSGSDNIGDFHQRVHAELKAHQTNGQPFRCFVNPDRPDQSILYRDLRWEMIAFYDIFVLTFGGFGWAMFLGSVFAWRAERRRAALAVDYPDQPWLWRDDWAANEIEATHKNWFSVTAAFTLFWNLMTVPLWWLLPPQIARGNYTAFWAMILPGIGLILIVVSIRMLLRERKYGRCIFRITVPQGVIGSELSGVIETSRPVECDQFQVVLLCQRKVTKDEDNKTIEVWRSEQTVPNPQAASWGDGGTSIPVQFEVPANSRPTGEVDDGTILWTLRTTSADSSVRFKVEFHVPVFRPSV